MQHTKGMPFGHDWDGRLDEWLAIVGEHDPYEAEDCDAAPTWSFPTDALVKEYLVNVESRPEGQVLHLLRCFLFEYATFGGDRMHLQILRQTGGSDAMAQFMPTEHGRRLLQPLGLGSPPQKPATSNRRHRCLCDGIWSEPAGWEVERFVGRFGPYLGTVHEPQEQGR